MRLTLLARADKTGLGYQTQAYYKHLKPNKTVVIDLSILNGQPQDNSMYPGAEIILGIPDDDRIDSILDDTDVLLTAETPYNLSIYTRARQRGIKTVCVENPEFYDHIKYPEFDMPDLIILPSVWKFNEIRHHANSRGTRVINIHHPVDRDLITFRIRETHRMLHIAGSPAVHDRNGTIDFLQCCPEGTVTTQSTDYSRLLRSDYRHSTVYDNIQDNNMLYQLGDILVMPRKYGGNCLPLNEALASGMPVIMTDIEPNNNLLPAEWLVPASIVDRFEPRTAVDIYQANYDALIQKMAWFRAQDMKHLSQQASEIADTISWTTLLPRWQEALHDL